MDINKLPFNISLLPADSIRIKAMFGVQSLDIFSSGTEFHPQGLYSTVIFGQVGTPQRQQKSSYIDTRTEVMHPKVFQELVKLKGLYQGIAAGSTYAIWDDKLKDFIKSNIIDGKTGYSFLMDHFHDIIHATNDSAIRDLRIKFLNKAHDQCMYRYIVVIPAGLRDIEIGDDGRPTEDDINLLYRKLIRSANTISIYSNKVNDPVLNTVRWNLQKTWNEIYDHIESVCSGKRGFILSKVAARNIHGGTRGVITGMDPAPHTLGSKEAVTINDSICGLHQYLKGTVELSIYNIRTGPLQPVIEFLPTLAYVVDAKTLKRKNITPSPFIVNNWGTEEGLEKLINGFEKETARHKPIMIDGDYAALLYRDHKQFKVFYDIETLPSGFSKSNVKPITWMEMFYISVYVQSKHVAGTLTRYPIESMGSIYPSNIYLKTTVRSESLIMLNDAWHPMSDEYKAVQFPILNEPSIDSFSPHVSHYKELNADNDGDENIYL